MRKISEILNDGTWRYDLLASVVVFLVALPLCMGIAIASGVPVEQAAGVGIMTGIIGGIVVGVFAGSPLLITGPAAGLSVLVYELVQKYGWASLGLIVLLAGAMQFVAGVSVCVANDALPHMNESTRFLTWLSKKTADAKLLIATR